MEVGVDVPRLGLLTIMFQPKSTAQYIQVSGRVGRDRENGPGLVIMLYNSSRARDRSVYEKFTTYHQRLYAQVEPVSVTPFAIESMKHGLVGSLLSHYRSTSQMGKTATTVDAEVFEKSVQVLQTRLELVANNPLKLADLKSQSSSFLKKWKNYQPTLWNYSWQKEKNNAPEDLDTALMRARREPIADIDDQSELVPSSLRNVDGQTQLRPVANPYQEYSDE
jgi:superfamily II DNA or RNA helicase